MYTLENRVNSNRDGVVLVGCGGTGGFVAEGLCRLLSRQCRLILVDQDVVERVNLVRQNFFEGDLGLPKAQVLAERLARQFNRQVGYSLKYLENPGYYHPRNPLWGYSLVIGCVDNPIARKAISDTMEANPWGWWIDAGNAENWGQVLIGNATRGQIGHSFDSEKEKCRALPLPSIQRPELLLEPPAEEVDPDCADAVQVGDQSPTINHAMASLVLEVTRRLLQGTCPWMSLFLDLDTGEMKPTYATPENVSRMIHKPVRNLTYRR